MSDIEAESGVILAKPYVRYSIAIVVFVAALLLREAAMQVFGLGLPRFIFFYPAVMLVGVLCGLWPGVLTTALAALAVDYWMTPPRGSFAIANPADGVALAVFVVMGVLMSVLAERYRRHQRRIAALQEQRKADVELREREALLRTVTEHSHVGLVLLSTDRRYLYVNAAYAELFGLRASDIMGKSVPEVLAGDYSQIGPRLDRAFAGERVTFERKVPARPGTGEEGHHRFYTVSYEPLRAADEDSRVIVVVLDITGRKRAEEQLQKVNRTLKALSNSNHALLHATSESDFLQQVCRIVREDCGHAMVWIGYAENDEDKTVRPVASAGFEEGYLDTLKITWSDSERGRGPTGTAIRTGQRSMCRNMLEDPSFLPWREEAVKRGYAASLVLPVMEGDRAFGAMTIYSRELDAFSDGEVNLLTELAEDLSHGISTLRLRGARAEAEQAVLSSQAKLQGIIGSAMDAVISVDEQQRIVVFNRAAENVFQCAAADALGSTLDRFIPTSVREHHHEHIRRFGSHGVTARSMHAPAILTGLRANGEEFPIEATISQVQAEGERLYTVILRDITERRRAEEKLRESEERLQLFIEYSPAALAMFDTAMRYLHVSRRWMADYGLGDRDLRGVSHYEVFPEISEQWKQAHRRGLAGEVLREEAERFDRADGSVQWVRWEIRPWRNAKGEVGGILIFTEDITERKQAEEARARLAAIVDSSSDPIISKDLDGVIVSWNQSAERLFGYSADEIIGRPLGLIIPPDRRGEEAAFLERLRRGDRVEHYETVRVDRSGGYIDVSLTISPIRDASGTMTGTSASVRDITERKQAEEELRESQAQFRTLADAIPQLCWIANPDGFIYWYNARWYEYTGATPEQVEGWGWQSVHDPAALPQIMERWKGSIASGNPFDMVVPLRGGDGVFRPFLTRGMPVKDSAGKVVRWFGTNTDVTELRNAQNALRASEQRWSTTLQSIGDAVIATDTSGKIEFMNDVAKRLTGWSWPEAKGQELDTVFTIVQEVTRIKPESPVVKVMRLGTVVGLANHTALIRRDGSEIPIEDSGAPIRNREGKVEGVVLVFHDVSEQRKVEKVLRNSDRLATTGKLAATIAHEIHNPLDAVGNLLYLIGEGSTEETTRQYVSMASQELARVTQMTQQMLSFQREAAKPVEVRIGEILENVIALYDRKIKSAEINLRQQIEFDGPILALPGELRQMFANLIGNAIEAVGPRHGTITLRAYASRDWRRQRPGVRVVIADDGPGIPPEVRASIFEPFFTTKGESGTGLGLWITSDILRKYGGTMRLRSSTESQHSGTCFSIFFPLDGDPGSPRQL